MHQSKIAHPAQQAVGNAGRAARAAANFRCAVSGDLHAQDARRALHHAGKVVRAVIFQPRHNAESVTQGRRDQAHARGRPHKGEGLKINLDRARRRPLPDDQIELEIFHGGIQHFFHGNGHAVDFVHKKDVVPVQIGEDGGKVAAALKHRPGGADKIDPQLGGHDLRQRGFAKPRIAVKKRVIQRLAALARSPQIHAQIGAQFILPDKVVKAVRAYAFVNACGALRNARIRKIGHQTFPLARALRVARSAPVTSRSGSSCSSFLTKGAHSSGS